MLTNKLSTPDLASLEREFITHLTRLVQFDTSNPPGHEKGAALYLESILKQEGLKVKRYEPAPGRVNLVVRLPANDSSYLSSGKKRGARRLTRRALKPLILLSHLDVVPTGSEPWRAPPFSGEIKEHAIWGRGTLDMKSMVVLELLTLLRLAREKLPLKRDIVFMALADEENHGKLGAEWLTTHHPEECDADFVLNEGGPALKMGAQSIFSCQHAEKGVLWLELTSQGNGSHGSIPGTERAIEQMLVTLKEIEAFREKLGKGHFSLSKPGTERREEQDIDLPALLEVLKKSAVSQSGWVNALSTNTVTVTRLEAGNKTNVVPKSCMAMLDCRLLPEVAPEKVLQGIQQVARKRNVQLKVLAQSPPSTSPLKGALFQAIETAVHEEVEKWEQADGTREGDPVTSAAGIPSIRGVSRYHPPLVTPLVLPAATDSRFFRQRGITAYGFCPFLIPPELIATIHGKDERLPLAAIPLALAIFYRLVRSLCVAES